MEITGLLSRGRGTNGMGHSNASIVTYSVVVKKKLHVQAWWPTNKWSREVEVAGGRGGGWGESYFIGCTQKGHFLKLEVYTCRRVGIRDLEKGFEEKCHRLIYKAFQNISNTVIKCVIV